MSNAISKILIRSSDGGLSFDTLDTPNFPNAPFLNYDLTTEKLFLYLGNDLLYISHDYGDNWQFNTAFVPWFFFKWN
jgi:hypothetical protein